MPTKKNIESPEKLRELFEEYKDYCKKNPKYENILSHKTGEIHKVPREVSYTWSGFEVWLFNKKVVARLDDYRFNKENRYSEYAYILDIINKEIYNDKINGAVAGIFNQNIIARDLGLVDKQQVDQNTKVKNPYEGLTTEELRELAKKK